MDFLWHKVSEYEKNSIKKQAKEIIDNFSSKMKGIELAETEIKRDDFTRKETKAYSDADFRKRFFKNCPKTKDDFIIAEKGDWK